MSADPPPTKPKISSLLRSGTAAGILVALVVILLFILAATFLKSLIFGIILACFFLPLEKFYERAFSRWAPGRAVWAAVDWLTRPVRYLKNRLAGKPAPSKQELETQQRMRLIRRASLSATASFLIGIALVLLVSGSLLIPAAMSVGTKIKESPIWQKTMDQVDNMVLPEKAPANAEEKNETEPKESGGLAEFIRSLRETVPEYIRVHHKDLANLIFKGSRGLASGILSVLASLGIFAFDLLLSVFFFLFFLQHLAYFQSGEQRNESIGNWCVRGIFDSRWMPKVSERTRQEAVEIIDWIASMLVRWVRGYLWIIIIETLLYLIAFSLCSVPYAPLLAMLAGMTILLPFLGPIGSFLLTVIFCLAFCRDHLVGTLIGVVITYLLINGILEQLFLYPKLVGGAMELSTMETIIVVLLGGLIAGIPGMILAMPAAAVLKYLIPKIYQVIRKPKE
ncbi:MAG: AI-2E family transporter [Lentisphaeria bacterium]|nr:AI-2E family transporter [Lentisphaeria bacterium]